MDTFMYPTSVKFLSWDSGAPPVDDLNIHRLSENIVNDILYRRSYGQSDQVLFPWGNDFQHYFAIDDYNNLDKLIDYINKNSSVSGVRVQYSTLNDYFTAVGQESVDWPSVGPQDW